MLEKPKSIKDPGEAKSLSYLLTNIIGDKMVSISDIKVLCHYAPSQYHLSCDTAINYCLFFGWVDKQSNQISLSSSLLNVLSDSTKFNDELITQTVQIMFDESHFNPGMFTFNVIEKKIEFRNEQFPLYLSVFRNMLISQGFFLVERSIKRSRMFVNNKYEHLVYDNCKSRRKFTIEQLKKQLERDAEVGEIAEQYVLEYEKNRISNSVLSQKIKIISDIDVGAGYDIISFEDNKTQNYNRFIEVKAITSKHGFFWSRNEYDVARVIGKEYYLYLVNVNEIGKEDYKPLIINNPIESVMKSLEWLVEANSFHIVKIK